MVPHCLVTLADSAGRYTCQALNFMVISRNIQAGLELLEHKHMDKVEGSRVRAERI